MKRTSLLLAAATLAACNGQLDHLGKPPSMSTTGRNLEPRDIVAEERVAVATPAAAPARYAYQQGSLFTSGQTALIGDRRARQRGDILTIVIEIDESAEMRNSTDRSRTSDESLSVGALVGLDSVVKRELPTGTSLDPAVEYGGNSRARGTGSTRRNEKLEMRLAATVVDVLPNGHLVVQGDQEVRVNFELRDMQVTGIVRPEDITRRNEVSYDRIAGARIAYGGRGDITDMQQPRLGQQISDILLPF